MTGVPEADRPRDAVRHATPRWERSPRQRSLDASGAGRIVSRVRGVLAAPDESVPKRVPNQTRPDMD